jgi:hypothetical protein
MGTTWNAGNPGNVGSPSVGALLVETVLIVPVAYANPTSPDTLKWLLREYCAPKAPPVW